MNKKILSLIAALIATSSAQAVNPEEVAAPNANAIEIEKKHKAVVIKDDAKIAKIKIGKGKDKQEHIFTILEKAEKDLKQIQNPERTARLWINDKYKKDSEEQSALIVKSEILKSLQENPESQEKKDAFSQSIADIVNKVFYNKENEFAEADDYVPLADKIAEIFKAAVKKDIDLPQSSIKKLIQDSILNSVMCHDPKDAGAAVIFEDDNEKYKAIKSISENEFNQILDNLSFVEKEIEDAISRTDQEFKAMPLNQLYTDDGAIALEPVAVPAANATHRPLYAPLPNYTRIYNSNARDIQRKISNNLEKLIVEYTKNKIEKLHIKYSDDLNRKIQQGIRNFLRETTILNAHNAQNAQNDNTVLSMNDAFAGFNKHPSNIGDDIINIQNNITKRNDVYPSAVRNTLAALVQIISNFIVVKEVDLAQNGATAQNPLDNYTIEQGTVIGDILTQDIINTFNRPQNNNPQNNNPQINNNEILPTSTILQFAEIISRKARLAAGHNPTNNRELNIQRIDSL